MPEASWGPLRGHSISSDTGLPQREAGREMVLSHASDRSLNEPEKVQ